MTMIHTASSTISLPRNGTFSRVASALSRYLSAKSEKAELDARTKQLAAMDPHMLNDIGLKGFDRLATTEQYGMLLDAVKNAKHA